MPRSNLDLVGQASEDERRPSNPPLHSQLTPTDSSPRGSSLNNTTHNSSGGHAPESSSGILSFLPSPIDLWDKRTPASLLLLPIVFCIYVILQLPLHYNAKNTVRTIDDLSETEWKGRAREVDELSNKLHNVKKDLGAVNKNQKQIKGTVNELKHRLHYLKMRRGRREVYLNTLKKNNDRSDDEVAVTQPQEQLQQQLGVAKNGPLASLSIVTSAAVATFAGKNASANIAKKED